MAQAYIEGLAARRPANTNVASLLASLGLLFMAWFVYYAALEPIPDYSEGWQRAVRGARFARMGWALYFSMLGLWLMAKAARAWFGFPAAHRAGPRWFVRLRNGLTIVLLFILLVALAEPTAKVSYSDDRYFIGGSAFLVWLAFAIDLVPLVKRAFTSLGARVSALSFKPSTVAGTESGRVRIEGTVVLGEHAVSGGSRPGKLVYQHTVDSEGKSDFQMTPFVLEAGGHRLFVDVVLDRSVFLPTHPGLPTHPYLDEIGEGDKVEVWGHVARPDDAYRGQPSRMTPGEGRLFVFQGGRRLNRRLVFAAAVELLASAALLLVGITFVFYIFDLYLFLI